VLLLGDIQYNSSSAQEIRENFAKTWAEHLPNALPIPGNHEYARKGAVDYYEFFRPPNGTLGYYSYDISAQWTIIALNTSDGCRTVTCDKMSAQYAWVAQALSRDRCYIAISHHPRYSSGPHGDTRRLSDIHALLSERGVVALVSGHDHHYERRNGEVTQYVVGTGGKDLRRAKRSTAPDHVVIDDRYGALFITFLHKSAVVRFIDVHGTVLDRRIHGCR
jgi:3',5'-cyclic AMP phosphodiesterase CpdA